MEKHLRAQKLEFQDKSLITQGFEKAKQKRTPLVLAFANQQLNSTHSCYKSCTCDAYMSQNIIDKFEMTLTSASAGDLSRSALVSRTGGHQHFGGQSTSKQSTNYMVWRRDLGENVLLSHFSFELWPRNWKISSKWHKRWCYNNELFTREFFLLSEKILSGC